MTAVLFAPTRVGGNPAFSSTAVNSTGGVAITLGSFAVSITAADPDSSAIAIGMGSFAVSIAAAAPGGGSIALTMGSFAVSIAAADPDSSAVSIDMGSFGVTSTAAAEVAADVSMFVGSFGVDIEVTSDPVDTSDDATISVTMGQFVVSVTAANSEGPRPLTLSEIMVALFNPLVGGRVWQDATPDNLPRGPGDSFLPFVLWSLMGGRDEEYVDQTMPQFSNARVQIHVNTSSSIATEILMRRVRDAFLASPYTVGVLGSPVGTYDASRKLRGRRQQFSIWFRQ